MDRPSLAPYEEKIDQLMAWTQKTLPSFAARVTRPKLAWMEKPSARKIGTYNMRSGVISLNHMYHAQDPDSMRQEVVPHEFAHHLTRIIFPQATRAHGKEFKMICVKLGIPPKSTSKAFTGVKKHRTTPAYCPCGCITGVTYTIARRLEEGKAYRCKQCKGPITLKAQEIKVGR